MRNWKALLPLIILGTACQTTSNHKHEGHAAQEHVELALMMKDIQYFTHKLGLALQADNHKLANFYVHELEEGLGEVYEVKEYDKLPIGATAKKIMPSAFEALDTVVVNDKKAKDALPQYEALLKACNQCHNATQHGFIRLVVPTNNPFNQDFRQALE